MREPEKKNSWRRSEEETLRGTHLGDIKECGDPIPVLSPSFLSSQKERSLTALTLTMTLTLTPTLETPSIESV